MEFYFSDANLPTDAFLIKKVKANEEGWVNLSVIASFNRMKQVGAYIRPLLSSTGAIFVTEYTQRIPLKVLR